MTSSTPHRSRPSHDTLDPLGLIEFTRFHARQAERGQYPFVRYDDEHRWHRRIYRDPRVDVWLISWLPTQATELHDHGGSSGSFTVVAGTLTETVVSAGRTNDSRWGAGASVGFGADRVHDVRNLSAAPALSVHAYSPPLRSMSYYDMSSGRLVRTSTVVTEDPEPAVDRRHAS